VEKKIAYRFRVIVEIYEGKKSIDAEVLEEMDQIYQKLDEYTEGNHSLTSLLLPVSSFLLVLKVAPTGWLTTAREVLDIACSKPRVTNYIVTNGPIIPTIAKLLLFKLDKYFPIHCIYSSRSTG
jgi:hypothetical protein